MTRGERIAQVCRNLKKKLNRARGVSDGADTPRAPLFSLFTMAFATVKSSMALVIRDDTMQ